MCHPRLRWLGGLLAQQVRYRIDGYTLELHHDNGRVERRFFYTDDERKSIWFDSGEMILPRKR